MFHTYQYISIQTTVHTKNSGGSLTDNRMPSHFLGNHGGITAQKYRHRRNAVASMRLGQLIDGASVECAVNSPPSGVELDIRVGVLSACKASIAQQLLDGVIQATKEEDQALVSVESLSKVSPLDPFWDVSIDGLLGQRAGLAVSDVLRTVLSARAPFQHPIARCLRLAATDVRHEGLCLLAPEWRRPAGSSRSGYPAVRGRCWPWSLACVGLGFSNV